jgi:cytoskeletal protein RodZ
MNCPNCNHPMDDDAFFCKNCGAWIIQKDQPDSETPTTPKPRRKPSKRRVRRRNIMLTCLMLVLVAGVAAVYFLALSPMLNDDSDAQQPNNTVTDSDSPDTTTPDDSTTPNDQTTPDDTTVPDDSNTTTNDQNTTDDDTTPDTTDTTPDDTNTPDDTTTTADSGYLLPSDSRLITEADLDGLTQEEVALARNEIYARYGRTFKNADYQAYFDAQSWYEPDPNYSDDTVELSEIEKTNANFILSYEQAKGWQ